MVQNYSFHTFCDEQVSAETNEEYDQETDRWLAGEMGDIGIYGSLEVKVNSTFNVGLVGLTPYYIYVRILTDLTQSSILCARHECCMSKISDTVNIFITQVIIYGHMYTIANITLKKTWTLKCLYPLTRYTVFHID